MYNKNKFKIMSPLLLLLLVSCVAGGTTDPVKVGAIGGIIYTTGQNETLNGQIADMEETQRSLDEELTIAKSNLNESVKKLDKYLEKLNRTRFKTKKSAEAAQKVSLELELKRQDILEKERELDDLENRVRTLKAQKKATREKQIRLKSAEEDLQQTKKEIALLTDVLKNDLFIEAENALMYE